MPWLKIDTTSSVPVYKQIVDGIEAAIARGEYRPGDRLPSVRQLAVELLVNPNTVARAYRELEREGLTRTRRGDGIFVEERAASTCRRARREHMAGRIGDALREALRSGIGPEEMCRIVEKELHATLGKESAGQRRGETNDRE